MNKNITVIGRGADAKLLATELGCSLNNRKAKVGIRYGIRKLRRIPIQINNDSAVALASNKFASLRCFKNEGLLVPEFSLDGSNLSFPVLGRKFFHSKGTDIVFLPDLDSLRKELSKNNRSDYFVQYIKPRNEYRIHVVLGDVVSIGVKINGDRESVMRNLSTGWTMTESKSWSKFNIDFHDIGKRAIRCLGLNFGAVDVLLSQEPKLYVLEVNTAPGLIERRAKLYAKSIIKQITR